jgi:crossover junction endodeoxyribonuclease RuvC
MRVLGIDPGFGIVGFGVIEYKSMSECEYVSHGSIKTAIGDPFGTRLIEIATDLEVILNKYKPDKVIIEQLFFAKNITTAMKVSQAKGVILLQIAKYGLEAINITPLQVKIGLTGNGKAQKSEVRKMVKEFLKKPSLKGVDDSIDALAVAIAGVGM